MGKANLEIKTKINRILLLRSKISKMILMLVEVEIEMRNQTNRNETNFNSNVIEKFLKGI